MLQDSVRDFFEDEARPLGFQRLTIVHVQTRMNRSGGCEENTWASCVHQAESGHDVHLVCGASSDVDAYVGRHDHIAVHQVPEMVWNISPRWDVAGCLALKNLLVTLNADVVHTHSSKAGILGRIAGKMAGVPMIVHGVHILPFSNVGPLEKLTYLAVEHLAGLITDHFIHVSEGTRNAYYGAKVGGRKPHSVVRSGMEIDKFKSSAWPLDWKEITGVSSEADKPVTILMMAVMEARKRHAEFVREFASLTQPGDPVCLLLAGEGPERDNLTNLVKALGAEDRIKLLGHRSDPEKLIALSDFSVLASLREGLPRSIIQSQAGGRPVIVSPFPGIEEIVEHEKSGIIANSTGAEEVARQAFALVRDPARLEKYKRGALTTSVDDWSFPSMFAQLDAAYAYSLRTSKIRSRFQRKASKRPAVLAVQH